MIGCCRATGGHHTGHAPLSDLEAFHSLGHERRAQAPRVGEAGPRERLRVYRTVLRGEQSAERVGRRARPALLQLRAVQPVAAQPGLALAGDVRLQPLGPRLVERHGGDPRAPEADIDPGRLAERGSERLVQVARPDRQAEQRVVGPLDLRGEHAGRGGGGGGRVGSRLKNGDLASPPRGRAGAGRAHRTGPDDRDVDGGHPLARW